VLLLLLPVGQQGHRLRWQLVLVHGGAAGTQVLQLQLLLITAGNQAAAVVLLMVLAGCSSAFHDVIDGLFSGLELDSGNPASLCRPVQILPT
jgi:hypothetical protein